MGIGWNDDVWEGWVDNEVGIVIENDESNDGMSLVVNAALDEVVSIDVLDSEIEMVSLDSDVGTGVSEIAQLEMLDGNEVEDDRKASEELIGTAVADSVDRIDGAEGQWFGLTMTGGGAYATGSASFFGLRAIGDRFVFVVDRSGSMRGTRLACAKDELIRSINRLDCNARFTVIFYNTVYEMMTGNGLVVASDANKSRAVSWIDTISASGNTSPVGAMEAALTMKPDAVWLLSDGRFAENMIEEIGRRNVGRRAQIHAIAFHDASGEKVLKQIAGKNRGEYRFVKRESGDQAGRNVASVGVGRR